MGAGHPSLTLKKDRRDEIQVRSHRRRGEEAILGAAEGGEHLMVFDVAGMPFVPASLKVTVVATG